MFQISLVIKQIITKYMITQQHNNQAFYSQASWGRIEMKPHEQKKIK
jgi:hypothetical protein